MALNDVTFQIVQGLGRQVENADGITALLFSGSAPAGYDGAKLLAFYAIEDLEAAGVTEGHATYGHAWYQAREFWRINPGGKLWVGFGITYPSDLLAAPVNGEVRLVGILFSDFATLATTWQAGANTAATQHAPHSIIAGYFSTSTPLVISGAADQGLSTNPNVSVLVAGPGAGAGAELAADLGAAYVPALGAVLGAAALASVHESIAWVEKFNLSDGVDLDVIRLADGADNPSISTITGLDTKRYLVLRKHTGIAGTYLTDSHTSTAASNDLAYLEAVRTIDKARRGIRTALLPKLSGPLAVDSGGKLSPGTASYFESLTGAPLATMQSAGELSDYGVYIDPGQNVLATSTLTVQVKLVPRGVARAIVVRIGFAVTATF